MHQSNQRMTNGPVNARNGTEFSQIFVDSDHAQHFTPETSELEPFECILLKNGFHITIIECGWRNEVYSSIRSAPTSLAR